jgi:hypothetical protein
MIREPDERRLILIVDDEPDMLDSCPASSRQGYAHDGGDGRRACEPRARAADLMLTDSRCRAWTA